ncbi:MAG: hypothetical protein ACTSVU_05570 [Promethearchaeota archaeon]
MVRKNFSTNKLHNNAKKQRNNPKYHPKRKQVNFTAENFEKNDNFYDSFGLYSNFDQSYFDDNPIVASERRLTYEENLLLEKQKLLYQKRKAMAKEKSKSKAKHVDLKKVRLDF